MEHTHNHNESHNEGHHEPHHDTHHTQHQGATKLKGHAGALEAWLLPIFSNLPLFQKEVEKLSLILFLGLLLFLEYLVLLDFLVLDYLGLFFLLFLLLVED